MRFSAVYCDVVLVVNLDNDMQQCRDFSAAHVDMN